VTTEPLCSRCKRHPRARGQRYCAECRAAWKRDARADAKRREPPYGVVPARSPSARKETSGSGEQATDVASVPPIFTEQPVYRPYPDREPARPWYRAFLEHLAHHGGPRLAANHVGLPYRAITEAIRTDPAFADEYEAARSFYGDLIEWQSVDLARRKNNPLPYFARLKADQPEKYSERAQIAHVTNILSVGPVADVTEVATFLQSLLGNATPATRAELAALDQATRNVIEGEATALPDTPPTA
jgi:hypothetical protein